MERYTKEQRVIIVKTHYKYGESYAETVRKVSSHAMAIRIGHRFRAIWHRTTSFLGGSVKSRVCASKPQTIPELKAEIRRVVGESERQLCGNVIENFVERARVCQQSRGGRLWILCSTINRSVCTLYWNKNISTFWINALRAYIYIYIYNINSKYIRLHKTPSIILMYLYKK
jgi:hypothetical protein